MKDSRYFVKMFVRRKRETVSRKTKRGGPRAVAGGVRRRRQGEAPTPRTPLSHMSRVEGLRRSTAAPVRVAASTTTGLSRVQLSTVSELATATWSSQVTAPELSARQSRGRGGQASEQPPRRSGSGPRLPCGARVRLGRFGACQARAGLPPGRSVGPVARETPNRSTSSVRRDLCRFRAFSYLSLR